MVDILSHLQKYTSSDLTDALRTLNKDAFIPSISRKTPNKASLVGKAHTIKYIKATDPSTPQPHPIDSAPENAVLVIQAPPGAIHAVYGGLICARSRVLGVAGAVVEGRIRDMKELAEMGAVVFASGTSTMGAAPFGKVGEVGGDLWMGGDGGRPVLVRNGDYIVADDDGVVCVPVEFVDEVLVICERLTRQDELVMQAVLDGETLKDSIAKYRK